MELKLLFSSDLLRYHGLLIVPYGIETTISLQCCSKPLQLLIVPYGIETALYASSLARSSSFNCTLWN